MKVGILSYRQMPYISANTAIAYIVGEQISKKAEIVYIGRKQDSCQECVNEYNGKKISFLNSEPEKDSSRFENYLVRIGLIQIAFFKDAYALKRIINKESIDALICVTAPNEDAFIAMTARLNIPILLYQLDPFYNLHDIENKRLKRVFIRYLKRVKHLFTTELLMDIYKTDPNINKYREKISVLQFPKLVEPSHEFLAEQEGALLLYSGSLYGDRKPEFLIDIKRCLPDEYRIVFCGKCVNQTDEQKLMKNGIICKGYCTQEVLKDEVGKAHILINIGNTVRNQLPSKIIDYIATGKPIINLSQIEECSSKKILSTYRYSLDVNVKQIIKKKENIAKFVKECKGKRIPWNEIQYQYKEYSPDYVGARITKILEAID